MNWLPYSWSELPCFLRLIISKIFFANFKIFFNYLTLKIKTMILVRDVFSLKFGKARDVKALMQESKKLMTADEIKNTRVLFDLVGPAYTMVLEGTYNNLSDFESAMGKTLGKDEWRDWYQKFIPLIEKSYREIFTIVD
jgi:hypothetical protein